MSGILELVAVNADYYNIAEADVDSLEVEPAVEAELDTEAAVIEAVVVAALELDAAVGVEIVVSTGTDVLVEAAAVAELVAIEAVE